ncbi:gamma-glutamyltransferase family protein [Botrimarina hoheduenensis]|uniref:gamma-glutamyltransferase family protein n=1 Tax=Botrimarina hoheduenensis TaxID=2528000 RepID=UPI0018D4D436|nr:gamma-glutamyltransferase [Botrimarina hoheduenensis]
MLSAAWPSTGVCDSVEATKWAIATGHPAATAAGLAVLRDGGNVVDAAIAASLTLGVAEPYGSGLGGKMVLLYHDATTGKVSCVLALCPSAAAMDVERFTELPGAARKYGYHAVGVPGLPAGLHAAYERWGTYPWAKLVAPAARLAEEGIVVSEEMRELWAPHQNDLANDAEACALYLLNKKTPPVGAKLRNADLAETLRRFADHGADGFYRGETAQRIVDAAQAAGAPLTSADFSGYKPRFTEPLAVNFNGHRVYSSPAPLTGGATVLAALRASEHMQGPLPIERNADYIDRFGRLLRVLYPRVTREVADTPEAEGVSWELLSEATLRSVAHDAARLNPDPTALDPVNALRDREADEGIECELSAGTTHLVVADAAGNMVSLTQSLSLHFGAAVVAPGTGVVLNDSMSNFATGWRESPNYAGANKLARSTVSPVIATRDGLPTLAVGLPGGQRIPTMTLQIVADTLGARVPLEEAFRRPRFHLRRPITAKQPKNLVDLEEGATEEELATLRRELAQLGWATERKPANGLYFGGGNAIGYQPGGKLIAVADTRRTNSADGD